MKVPSLIFANGYTCYRTKTKNTVCVIRNVKHVTVTHKIKLNINTIRDCLITDNMSILEDVFHDFSDYLLTC